MVKKKWYQQGKEEQQRKEGSGYCMRNQRSNLSYAFCSRPALFRDHVLIWATCDSQHFPRKIFVDLLVTRGSENVWERAYWI